MVVPRALLTCSLLVLSAGAVAASAAAIGSWGFDLSGMDRTLAPGDDFYRFANGAWLARASIPADRPDVGPFTDLRSDADNRSRAIIEGLRTTTTAEPRVDVGKVAALDRSFLDEAKVEQDGAKPLHPLLANIAAASDRTAIARMMGAANASLGASVVSLDFGADHITGRGYELTLSQGELRLPREFSLDPNYASHLAAYRTYAAHLLALSGWRGADQAAAQVVALERELAGASLPAAETRDPTKTLNPTNAAKLEAAAPGFPWAAFLAGAGVTDRIRLNLGTPASVAAISKIFARTPPPVLRSWLAFHTADNAAPYLSHAFVDARFDFQKTLGGPATQTPRWKRGVALVNDLMGSTLGQLYVARYSTAESRTAMKTLVENVRAAFESKIKAAAWMSAPTRNEALRKLAALEVQVGGPAKPIDYTHLEIRQGDLFGNVLRGRAFDWRRRVQEGGGIWNKSDWRFWPQYPTAYNENQQLIFTAAMFQPPFFDPHADAAVNYGAIGAVIGHEISHNFDDQGRKIDAEGRQRDWWTPADDERFQKQGRRLSAQFSAMEPMPGLHVNGELTLGENIADLAGLVVALQAYHSSLRGHEPSIISGFTGDQRFFLSWAQIWREKDRPEKLRSLILSNVHSPASARVNGPLPNIDEWYAAWKVTPREKLYVAPVNRVKLW